MDAIQQSKRTTLRTLAVAAVLVIAYVLATDRARAAESRIASCVAIKATEPRLPDGVQRAWGSTSNFWPQSAKLRVRFLTGTKAQKAEAWKRFQDIDARVNLTFHEVTTGASEIRVRFDFGKGHWSYLGRGALTIPQSAQTMNLELKAGVFGDGKDEWDRVAIHEILHAIGFEHEHQSPLATKLIWNREAVYEYYSRTQGWSRAQIDFQVLNRSTAKSIVSTGFDSASIMEYPIPPGLANITVGWNTRLTARDIELMARIYPPAK